MLAIKSLNRFLCLQSTISLVSAWRSGERRFRPRPDNWRLQLAILHDGWGPPDGGLHPGDQEPYAQDKRLPRVPIGKLFFRFVSFEVFLIKGPVHQFYMLVLNEAFLRSDSENLSHSFVSCSKLQKKAKTLAFANAPIRTPKYKCP